jgi:hypothetical protein
MPLGVDVGQEILDALSFPGGMTWRSSWALILGFALSAVVWPSCPGGDEAAPPGRPPTVAKATGSAPRPRRLYAAVARPLVFRKGATSTFGDGVPVRLDDTVFELGIVLGL